MIRVLKQQLLFPISLIIGSTILIYSFFIKDMVLCAIAFAIIIVVYLPIVQKNRSDLMSIWSWIFYSSILGIFIRITYLVFELVDYDKLDRTFLLGKPKSDLIFSSVLMLIGFISLVSGYLMCNKSYKKLNNSFLMRTEWDEKRFFFMTIGILLVSAISLYIFIESNDGLFSGLISSYRGIAENLEDTNPQGYLRFLISLSALNIFILAAWLKKSKRLKFYAVFIFILSIIVFVFFNFFVSQRGAVVFIFAQLIAFYYYVNNFHLQKKGLILGVIISLGLFQIITNLRGGSNYEDAEINYNIITVLEPAVLTTNFVDISKTAHIIDAIPNKLPFAFGSTYLTIFFAPIPRSIWPSKPVVIVDNIIGREVFGSNTFGSGAIPPGLFAEAYWNFWVPGVLIVPFIIGFLLKYIENTCKINIQNTNIIILYVTSFMFLGLAFIGSSFSSVLLGFLQTFIPTYLILFFLVKPENVKNQ